MHRFCMTRKNRITKTVNMRHSRIPKVLQHIMRNERNFFMRCLCRNDSHKDNENEKSQVLMSP